jgi:hypothetical protein
MHSTLPCWWWVWIFIILLLSLALSYNRLLVDLEWLKDHLSHVRVAPVFRLLFSVDSTSPVDVLFNHVHEGTPGTYEASNSGS